MEQKNGIISNAQYSHDVYLQIGEQPKAPMEQEYQISKDLIIRMLMPLLDSQEYLMP